VEEGNYGEKLSSRCGGGEGRGGSYTPIKENRSGKNPKVHSILKVPKCEIFYRSDFYDFYTKRLYG
jgi:hypothetical protein